MTMPADPSGRLCEEILAEGRKRAEGIREETRQEGEAILRRAAAEAEKSRRDFLETTRREAARRRERILADVPIEIARMRAAHIEALLHSLRERSLRNLMERQGFEYREAILSLAAEALERMTGEAFVLSLASGDIAALGEGLAEEILRRAGRPDLSLTLSEDPSISGGLILRDVAGLQMWDDRLRVRLDRLWPGLRLPVARGAGLLESEGGAP